MLRRKPETLLKTSQSLFLMLAVMVLICSGLSIEFTMHLVQSVVLMIVFVVFFSASYG